ncbi:MAG TPA: dihydroorotase [Fibrobacteraceae bacterium]|nr:dihydroorotase [Fibrobacteraceae bacterium]
MNNYCFAGARAYVGSRFQEPADFWVQKGKWVKGPLPDAHRVEAQGCWILPGLSALLVDFQEPIRDDVYTLHDGFEAMHRGGFYSALYESAANPLDDIQKLKAIRDACGKSGLEFHFLGALSVDHAGKSLSEMLELASGGVVGFGDGDRFPTSLRFIRLALEYAGMTGLRCFFQPLETSLMGKGCVHEGHYADAFGIRGIPSQAETIAVHQILELAGWLKVPVHLKQITCRESLSLLRLARDRGIDVTCDVSVNHLLFDDSSLEALDTNMHLRPPLRTAEDRTALWNALSDGTIQAISCAHVPVLPQDKETHFEDAQPGAVSLEIALAALLPEARQRLCGGEEALLTLLVDGPSRVLGLPPRTLAEDQNIPFLLYDPRVERKVQIQDFCGQVHNSPLLGAKIQGKVLGDFFDGSWRPTAQ